MSWFRRTANAPPSRLSSADTAQLSAEIARLAQAGLPLPAGLRALADEAPSRRLRRGLLALADRLERGEPLEQALSSTGRRLPAYFGAMLSSPTARSRLAALLSSQLEEERRACQLQREARAAAIYPTLIAGLFLLVFCGLIGILSRPITDIMNEFGLDLPWSTQLLSDLSEHGLTVVLAAAVGALVLWLLLWVVLPRARAHAALKLIPLYGPLWRYTTLARWSRTMAQLVDAQVPLPEAIRLAGDSTDDADLATASRDAALGLERGAPLALALGGEAAFPRWFGATLAWGVNQHRLTSALLAAGDAFAARARRQISFIGVAMPAIAFLIVIWGATFLFAAAFGPMVRLIEMLT